MASSIARHISTVSLISTASLPREGGVLAQALNRYRDQIEAACDKILEKCCTDNRPGSLGDQSEEHDSVAPQAPRVLEDRAREILTQYLIELLSSLILPEPLPQSIRDVNARLAEGQLCFPDKLMPTKAELEEFHALAEKGKKVLFASLDLPVDKIFSALKELAGRFNYPTCIYITAVTEKVISNFLKMVIYFEERARSEHVISAVTIQNIFQFYRDRVKSQRKQMDITFANNFPQDYNKCVDELVLFLSSSLEQMNLILRVFREPILHSPACASLDVGSEEAAVREVFRDALDLYNNFRLLLDYLESDCADDLPFTFSSPLPPTSQQREADDSFPTTSATENRRLVGRLLIEPAEEIALASYSDSPDPLDNIWRLSERIDVLESLARSSRTIVHTISRLKTTSTDVMCLHSLCCSSCRMWDQKEYSSSTAKDTAPPSYKCNAVINCFRYLLPRLLLLPIFQFFHFYRLVHALYQQAYDSEDRKLLMLVVDYLLSARLNIKSVLTRYPDLHVQLARLVTTGHLVTAQMSTASNFCGHQVAGSAGNNSRHRSCSASPATSMTPPIRRDSSTQHQHRHYRCNTPPPPPQSQPPQPSHQTPIAALSAVFCAGGGYAASPLVMGTPTTTVSGPATTTVVMSEEEVEEHVDSMMSALMSGDVSGVVTKAKLEELERLTGGKDRLLFASVSGSTMGKFVMEGRLWVRDEGKRVASERQAYLFTNCLLLCKRVERRTTLAPSMVAVAGAQPLLRVKRRLPLEAAHVIDCVAPVRPRSEASSGSHPHNSLAECASLLSATTSFSRCLVSDSSQRLHATVEEVEQCSFSLEFFGNDQRQLCNTFDGVVGGDGSSAASALSSSGLEMPQGVQFHYLHLETSCPEEKADWMASLLSITTSHVYERYLRTLPKLEIPLRLPSPDKYRFAQPDTPEVIVFESAVGGQSSGAATITHRLLQPSLSSRIRSTSTTVSADDPFDSPEELDDEVEVVDVEFFPTTPTDEDSLGGADEDLALPLPASTSSRIHSPHLGSQTLTSSGIPNPTFHHPAPHRPQIQYATLEKLIERLTFPTYFDAEAVNAFLISYRRFITSEELLDLLMERFNVPYPEFTAEELKTESVVEHMKRRFRSGYKRWVQARVVSFLFRWVSSPRYFAYDFAPNADLRARLATFLAGVRVRILLPVVQAIEHVLSRSDLIPMPVTSTASVGVAVAITEPKCHHPAQLRVTETVDNQHLSPTPPLSPESSSRIDLLQIHPLELAEQVTLHEFELYRRIEFWEVDGRERPSQDSPNLSACKNFSNKFRDWLVHSILAERNFEDRVVAIQRIIDLMLIFEHQRNLQGRQESKAVLLSAAVFRLKKAFEAASRARPYRKCVQQLQREGRGAARRVTKAIRGLEGGEAPTSVEKASIATASPCLPYIAMRVSTQLIHLELHQPDRVTPTGAPFEGIIAGAGTGGLINFAKQRRLAEIVERFLQHQLMPYAFSFKPRIQQALVASLEAFTPEDRDFEARMYALSESYEPRESPSEPPQPAPEVERRLSKEAIQAANFLGGLSLKDKLQHEQVANYKAYFGPRQMKSSGRVSAPRLSGSPTSSIPVPPPSPSPPLLTPAPAPPLPPPPSLASAEQRVVVLWNTRLRQHRAGQQARLTLAHGVATPSPRPLSSPTAASSTGVIHHHSVSDGQIENLSNGRLPAYTVPPFTSPLPSPPPPPPPPPRRQSNGGPSTSSPASASHSPSPLFPLTTVLTSTLVGEGAAAVADGGLPPLPPKPGQRTSSVVVGLSPSASSSASSRQFFDTLHPENLVSTPPLPPRRHIS
ncbi:Protein son of sevenles [Taenia solium]|eukprot:TsM_000656200 transcript=TsM_000656200 gene=TsM_000656200